MPNIENSILLTGATGFLGSHLLENFLKNNYKVGVVLRSDSDVWRIREFLNDIVIFNIEKNAMPDVFDSVQPSVVVHTACSYGRKGEFSSAILETNVLFGLKVLETAIKKNVRTFINTDTLLPKEVSVYSLSNAQFKEWLLFYSQSIRVVNMRLEHIYGPKDGNAKFLPWLIHEMTSGGNAIELTSGKQKRSFLFIKDVALAFNLVLEKKESLDAFTEFDVATDELLEVRDFIEMVAHKIEKLTNSKIRNRLNFGAKEYRENDVMVPVYNNNKIKQLGWKPTTNIEKGLDQTINHFL